MQIRCDDAGNPLLEQFSEEGFVDCTFKIRWLETTAETHQLQLSAVYARSIVGFRVVVTRGIQAGFDANMNLVQEHVYRPAVRFLRSGPESDRLLLALAELYGARDHAPGQMAADTSLTGIALHQGAIDMEKEAIKIKLFGCDASDDPEEDYFESFFNLDLPAGFVFWNEKDPEYRAALLRGLSAAIG
jgi:hypothetical protein